jgi:hypothetical protein
MFLSSDALGERSATVLRALGEIAQAYYFQGSLEDVLHV